MTIIILSLGELVSYLIGSIPTAYIFGKTLKGIDIREFGSERFKRVLYLPGLFPSDSTKMAIYINKGGRV